MTLRIALLGAGRIGQVHAKAIAGNPDATLAAVADFLPAAAKTIADQYGCVVRDVDDIVNASDIDAVLVCTPTNTHADLIEALARAGKPVFCEKPIDLDIDRVRRCLDTVEQAGGLLMIGFNRRFDPHFRALKSAIADGRIGTIEQIHITSRDPGLPPHDYIAHSGGIFRDMTIHDFDMARFLLDAPIVSVFAVATALVDPSIRTLDDFDTASVVMEAASGAQVTITNSRRASYGYDQRIEVHGSEGMVQAENQRPADIVVAGKAGFTQPVLHDFFMTRYLDAYAGEIDSFIRTVRGTAALEVTGHDGLVALELAEAALASIGSGKKISV